MGSFAHAYLFSWIKEFFLQRLQLYFSPVVLYYDQFIRKLLGTIALQSRRLINSTFAGQATLGACCRIINTAKWPQSKWALCIQKKKDFRGNHNSSLENLEKLILTALVTVTDCWFRGLLGMQRSKQCWLYSVLWSPPLLCCHWSLGDCTQLSVTWLTSHHTPWIFSSKWS